ncbi:MAG: redoxin domain-containing protein, partial [Sciscionella sp.]
LGVSVDTPFSLKAWAVQEGYTFPLLSDFWPHGAVAKTYGVFNADAGMAVRGTFLIDTDGVVRFAEVYGPGEARDQVGWKKAIRALDG